MEPGRRMICYDCSKDASRHHKTHRGRARLERTAPDLAGCKTLASKQGAGSALYSRYASADSVNCGLQAVCAPCSLL